MPVNMNSEEAAAFSKLEALADAQMQGRNGSAPDGLTPNERQLLITHADKIGERPSNPIERAGLQRTESMWIAGALGAMDPARTEAPFRSRELNNVYEAQQRFEQHLAERTSALDKSPALEASR